MLPVICIRLPGTRDIRYFQTKLFFTYNCALSITFAINFYVPSRAGLKGRGPGAIFTGGPL